MSTVSSSQERIKAAVPTNDINEQQANLPDIMKAPDVDHSGRIGFVPEVERKLQIEEQVKAAQGTKPRFMDDVKNFFDATKHPGPPDDVYNTRHGRDDVNAPNGGARGVAPDAAYQQY